MCVDKGCCKTEAAASMDTSLDMEAETGTRFRIISSYSSALNSSLRTGTALAGGTQSCYSMADVIDKSVGTSRDHAKDHFLGPSSTVPPGLYRMHSVPRTFQYD